jgi:2',3'-cyclic-nucleotide 2'-phosphodiesterase (5'-nucleotidase family)
MSNAFIVLILLAQISFLSSSKTNDLNKRNLKSEKKKDRKLEDILSDDIVIIHLNDVHCGVNDTIGYDGFVLYRDELKKKYKHVITVDVGDNIQGGTLGAITTGEAITTIMNEIKFDVNILGNHEFDYGVERLEELQSLMKTKYICANFFESGKETPVYDPYQIITVGDKKIAFIGIVTPLAYSKTYLASIKDDNGNSKYDLLSENNKLYETTQKYINEVRGEPNNVDYVILLTHIGMDEEEYTSNGLLSQLTGVNAVLDGHTHKVYNTTTGDKNNNPIPISQTGTKLANVGQLIIQTDGQIQSLMIDTIPEPSDKSNAKKITRSNKEVWVDTNMNDFLNNLWKEYETELNEKIADLTFDFIVLPGGSTSSSSNYCRTKECTLGNIITDSFKELLSVDLSLVNGGDIRTNLLKGEVTRKNIIDVLPFFTSIYVIEATGQTILDTLEFSASRLPNSFGGFLQISGGTFDIDTSIETSVETDSNGMFTKISGKRRVSNVKINGENIDLNKKYKVSVSEFIQSGGDGYSMLTDCEIINEYALTETDAFQEYLKTNLKGEIPTKYQNLEGRINIGDLNTNDDNESDSGQYFKKFLTFLSFAFIILLFVKILI